MVYADIPHVQWSRRIRGTRTRLLCYAAAPLIVLTTPHGVSSRSSLVSSGLDGRIFHGTHELRHRGYV